MGRLSKDYLRTVRNKIKINQVIAGIIKLDYRTSDGYFRFCCPICARFNTAVNSKTNLARCFDCKKNFNNIDIVMITQDCSFLEAVQILKFYL